MNNTKLLHRVKVDGIRYVVDSSATERDKYMVAIEYPHTREGLLQFKVNDEDIFTDFLNKQLAEFRSRIKPSKTKTEQDINVRFCDAIVYLKQMWNSEANKAKFTEEQVKKAIANGIVLWQERKEQTIGGLNAEIFKYLQSLTQPREFESVEVTTEIVPDYSSESEIDGEIFTSNRKEDYGKNSEGLLDILKINWI